MEMLKLVRDGKLAPLVCPDCGCRLNLFTMENLYAFACHFVGAEEARDAKGHICRSIGVVWSVDGDSIQHLLA